MHTNSMDETLALPTENAVLVALRTQQVIAEESGIVSVVDPLGGSYFVEWLTNKVEREAMAYIHKIDELGGMIAAIDKGYPQAEIANAAYHFQKQLETKEKVMVGVNRYINEDEQQTIDTLYIDKTAEDRQIKRITDAKKKRKAALVEKTLVELKKAALGTKIQCPILSNVFERIVRYKKSAMSYGMFSASIAIQAPIDLDDFIKEKKWQKRN